jgi:hypothetical protein
MKDCGKKEEIEDILPIDGHKKKTVTGRGGGRYHVRVCKELVK